MTVISREYVENGSYILGQSEVSHTIYAAINKDGTIEDIPEDDSNKADYYVMLEKILETGEIKRRFKSKSDEQFDQWPDNIKNEVNQLITYLEENKEGYPNVEIESELGKELVQD